VYTQRSESLRRSLTEADIAQLISFSDIKDMVNRIWNIVPCKVVYAAFSNVSDQGTEYQICTHSPKVPKFA